MIEFTAVIVNPAGSAVVVDSKTGKLPVCAVDTAPYFAKAAEYNAIVLEQVGVDVSTLQCLVAPGGDAPGAFAFRASSVDSPSTALRWVSHPSLVDIDDVVGAFLTSMGAGRNASPSPWIFPDWFPEVRAWVQAELGDHTCQPEQVKSWGISAVWRAEARETVHYFKAVPPLFGREPEITAFLFDTFGDQIPSVAAVDHSRHWMLMHEFVGPLLRHDPDIKRWCTAARQYGLLQRSAESRVDGLIHAGCENRPLAGLAADFDALADALVDDEFRVDGGLSIDEAVAVRTKSGYVRQLCERLAEFGLPDTLIHGDLHAGNIVRQGDRFLYFDWTDAAISHPFFDLITLVGEDRLKDEPEVRREILAAYCQAWKDWASTPDLLAAVDIAMKLAPAYHAVSYRRIRDASPPASRWELGPSIGYYLRMLP